MVVHPDSIRISRVRTYSGYSYWIQYISNTGLSPSLAVFSKTFSYIMNSDIEVLQPHNKLWFGLLPVRSSLLRESLLISFFRLLRYFSSPTFLHVLNGFGHTVSRKREGFLHSEIPGSKRGCSLPEAYRKLPTSFFGSISQGILYTPVVNFFNFFTQT